MILPATETEHAEQSDLTISGIPESLITYVVFVCHIWTHIDISLFVETTRTVEAIPVLNASNTNTDGYTMNTTKIFF